MTAMGYEGAGVYPGHYYSGCEDTRQHTWGGYHQQVAHPQGSPSQRYPYYDTRYTFLDISYNNNKWSYFPSYFPTMIPATVRFLYIYCDTTYHYYDIKCTLFDVLLQRSQVPYSCHFSYFYDTRYSHFILWNQGTVTLIDIPLCIILGILYIIQHQAR
jgi:hypothetical protein